MINRIFFLVIFFSCVFCFSTAEADLQKEEILFYGIDATLNQDSSLDVQETIKVRALGKDIKRGIYRDFPLKHVGEKTPVSILSVTRNGKDIPYTVRFNNGKKRLYLGDMKKSIEPSVYEYNITYKYHNIIRQNDEKTKDEFYYNLIGDEWAFDILVADAVVRLPSELNLIEEVKVFTGEYGAKKQNAFVEKKGNQIFIHLPNGLKKQEAMTLRTVFNSGFFQIPETGLFLDKRLSWLFTFMGIMLFMGLVFYAYSSWKKYGKDSDKKIAYPRFDVPNVNNLGALYLLWRYHHADPNLFDMVMPHLAHLSQRGLLKVKVLKNKIFFEKNKYIKPKNSDEKFFLEKAKDTYTLKKGTRAYSFLKYIEAYKEHSKSEIKTLYKRNVAQRLKFNCLAFLCCLIFFLLCFKSFLNFVPAAVLSFCVFPISEIVLMLFKRERNWISKLVLSIFSVGFVGVWCLLFFGGMFCSLFGLLENDIEDILFGPVNAKALFCVLIFACFVAFYKYIIVRVYDKGLFLIEHLEGIKMFLNGVDDLKYKTPKEAELDRLLPYAILLGMQTQWLEKMKSYFDFEAPKDDVFRNAAVFSTITSRIHSSATKSSNGGSGSRSRGFSGGGCSGGGAGGGGGGGF